MSHKTEGKPLTIPQDKERVYAEAERRRKERWTGKTEGEMKSVNEIREWYNAFRGHQFRCVPENAEVFERTVEEMRGHIRTLLSVVDGAGEMQTKATSLPTSRISKDRAESAGPPLTTILQIDASSADAIAYKIEQGHNNGDLSREILSVTLRRFASTFRAAIDALQPLASPQAGNSTTEPDASSFPADKPEHRCTPCVFKHTIGGALAEPHCANHYCGKDVRTPVREGEAPERIWIEPTNLRSGRYHAFENIALPHEIEYVRKNVMDAAVARIQRERDDAKVAEIHAAQRCLAAEFQLAERDARIAGLADAIGRRLAKYCDRPCDMPLSAVVDVAANVLESQLTAKEAEIAELREYKSKIENEKFPE